MPSIPSNSPAILSSPNLRRIAPQAIHFGNDSEDTVDIENGPKAKEPTEPTVKKGDFIQGSLSEGINRMFGMAFLRPLVGCSETIIDIVDMFFLIPPPFATKHFLEGFIGANSLFSKEGERSWTAYSKADNKDFHAEGYGNRTLVSAIWNGVFKVFGKQPSDFDIAKANESKQVV